MIDEMQNKVHCFFYPYFPIFWYVHISSFIEMLFELSERETTIFPLHLCKYLSHLAQIFILLICSGSMWINAYFRRMVLWMEVIETIISFRLKVVNMKCAKLKSCDAFVVIWLFGSIESGDSWQNLMKIYYYYYTSELTMSWHVVCEIQSQIDHFLSLF